jgi:hypothetical protein
MGFNFIEFIAATGVALVIWFLDKQKRPNLHIEVDKTSDLTLPQGNFKILNLKVKNMKRPGIRQYFDQTATQVRVYLTFKDFDSKVDLFTVIARWNTTREPLTPDYNKVDVGLALTNPREVISPNEEASLSVAIRKDGSNTFFAFNNESYLHLGDFAKPEWGLSDERVLISAKVQTAEIETPDYLFIISSKNHISSFKLSKLTD